jgi:hypothetical protein
MLYFKGSLTVAFGNKKQKLRGSYPALAFFASPAVALSTFYSLRRVFTGWFFKSGVTSSMVHPTIFKCAIASLWRGYGI